MTQSIPVTSIEASIKKSQEWLVRLEEIGGFDSESQAYSAMRAGLHALRDRLTVDEAAHLASHLPTYIRGVYYEGWKPAAAPNKERSSEAFLNHIKSSLPGNVTIDPEKAALATFALLDEKTPEGEIRHVREMLPDEIRTAFWPRK